MHSVINNMWTIDTHSSQNLGYNLKCCWIFSDRRNDDSSLFLKPSKEMSESNELQNQCKNKMPSAKFSVSVGSYGSKNLIVFTLIQIYFIYYSMRV